MLNSSENEFSKFETKKWYVIDSESKGNSSHKNPIKFLTGSLESSICDYSDAYILVTGNIAFVGVTMIQKLHLKIAHLSGNVEQKSMILLLMKQNMLMLQFLCKN